MFQYSHVPEGFDFLLKLHCKITNKDVDFILSDANANIRYMVSF